MNIVIVSREKKEKLVANYDKMEMIFTERINIKYTD